MEAQFLEDMIAVCDMHQLQWLQQKINDRLAEHRNAEALNDQFSLDSGHATYYSNAPTLYPSGRSTPAARSIASDWTACLPIGHHVTSDRPKSYPPESSAYFASGANLELRQPQAIVANDALGTPQDNPKVVESALKQFFCTYCYELGHWKTFGAKQDWKRHVEDYHDGAGLQWVCQVTGCSQDFARGLEFRNHLKKGHEGKRYPRDFKKVNQLQRIYACGFENCTTLSLTWKHHCDHLAGHMADGNTMWTYNRTIRNLLKHSQISAQWKQVCLHLRRQLAIDPHNLNWDVHQTRAMKKQLENHTFQEDIHGFLCSLFCQGLPPSKSDAHDSHAGSFGLSSHNTPPSIPPIPPISVGLGIDLSWVQPDIHQPGPDPLHSDLPSTGLNNRHSVTMMDAPNLPQSATYGTLSDDPYSEVPLMADELISVNNFIAECTPNYDTGSLSLHERTSSQSSTKSHSPRALVNKLFASKKPQHSQHVVVDHPDIPPSVRMPSSSSRKKGSTHRSPSNMV